MLANADRAHDRSTAYRDAIDLGMLALHRGPFPDAALLKAEQAYGNDVERKLAWVLGRLADAEERRHTSAALGMDPRLLDAAARALLGEFRCLRPGALLPGILPIPPHLRQTHVVDASLDGRKVAIRKRPPIGCVSGRLDNSLGPAAVFRDREMYFLDGVRCPNMDAWRQAVAQRGAK
ncbi:MAG: hypothetical protein P4L90_18135 [Rhodopila sp.]|nr:hypothetical protein [Rhodopila sp.]